MVLKDVDYVIEAHFEKVEVKWGEHDSEEGHYNIVLRRLRQGQRFQQIALIAVTALAILLFAHLLWSLNSARRGATVQPVVTGSQKNEPTSLLSVGLVIVKRRICGTAGRSPPPYPA